MILTEDHTVKNSNMTTDLLVDLLELASMLTTPMSRTTLVQDLDNQAFLRLAEITPEKFKFQNQNKI